MDTAIENALKDQGWVEDVIPVCLDETIARMNRAESRVTEFLRYVAENGEAPEDLIPIIVTCFPLPDALLGRLNTDFRAGGFGCLLHREQEDYKASSGLEGALHALQERALQEALKALGKPTNLKQYFGLMGRSGVARIQFSKVPEGSIEALRSIGGTMVASWESEEHGATWWVSSPIHNRWGRIIGHNHQLYFQDAMLVQEPVNGLMFEIRESGYDMLETPCEKSLAEFPGWSKRGGLLSLFRESLEGESPDGDPYKRFNLLLHGPSGIGKSTFFRAYLKEEGGFVTFKISPGAFEKFDLPGWLSSVAVILDDVDGTIPARDKGGKPGHTEAMLRKLELSPKNPGDNTGCLTRLAILMSTNYLHLVDSAVYSNSGRTDAVVEVLRPGWMPLEEEVGAVLHFNGEGEPSCISVKEMISQSRANGQTGEEAAQPEVVA